MFYERYLKRDILSALKAFPAVLITGARQTGKSTLAMELCDNYITLDDITLLSLAKDDPVMFVSNLTTPIVIDEIQKAPNLLPAIKMEIDKNRKAGQFILTGSANVLDFKNIGDTLAGRLAIFELSPLSHTELHSTDRLFIESLFDDEFTPSKKQKVSQEQIYQRVLDGMYPDVINQKEKKLKYIWFSSYIATYIERDVRDIENIRNIDKFSNLINILASRSGNLLNKSDIANATKVDIKTLENHLSLLGLIYQIKRVKPYHANIGKRFVKSEKLFFTDTGVLCFLLGIQNIDDLLSSHFIGAIYETFVFNELYKQITFLLDSTQIHYYRTHDKKEIDFCIERGGKLVAIEVKFAKSVLKNDFRHIIDLQKSSKNFHLGVVIYMGEHTLSFGDELWAVPFGVIC